MKTYSINSIGLLSMLILLSFDLCATDVVLNGRVRYYDSQTGTYKPVANAEIQIYTINPTVSPSPVVYTDNNGNFNKYLNVYPDQVDAHLFLRNEKIDLRGAITTRSIANIAVKINHPSCPDPLIPCHPWTTPPDFENMDMDLSGDEANYALIFDHANKAANFSIAQGFTPSQCIVKYPLQSSIINQVWISAKGSFFWPSSTVTFPPPDENFIETILSGIISLAAWFGYTGEFTANTIYINDLVKYNPSTVYHEYGHFIMKQKRGDWPVSQIEYATGVVPFDHNSGDAQQNSRQTYIEGWANYYEMAVSGWVANPSNPYSISKLPVNGENNKPVIGPDGYKHEYTVANAFWDFYDPANDENFQTSYVNISNVMGEKQNLMSEFISTLTHKSYITDQQRNAGIALMNLSSTKMNPLTSYGNATMYVKNDFNGGIVNINNSDINTSSLGGAFSTTELWMSNLRTLKAKEQTYDNYQRLFKHTRPSNQVDTWTTGDPIKKNGNNSLKG